MEAVHQARPKPETIVKRIVVGIAGAICIVASTCAFAQTSTGNAADQKEQNAQPGTAGQSMSRAAETGSSKPASDSLMQQREKGMSPQGASDGKETGKMKQ